MNNLSTVFCITCIAVCSKTVWQYACPYGSILYAVCSMVVCYMTCYMLYGNQLFGSMLLGIMAFLMYGSDEDLRTTQSFITASALTIKLLNMNKDSIVTCLYFQLHQATLTSLKGEIVELRSRLQRESLERDSLEKQLGKLHVSLSLFRWILFYFIARVIPNLCESSPLAEDISSTGIRYIVCAFQSICSKMICQFSHQHLTVFYK